MMKAILFACVLAVTIPVEFFSPTPLDSITMNLNIDGSPRGRHHGSRGYAPVWGEEEDVASGPTTTTTAPTTEQEVLEKIMQGVEDLNKLATSGKVSPRTLVGGDECSGLQIAECVGSLPGIVAKCIIQSEADILKCINEVLGDQSKCKPCVCFFLKLAGMPCSNTESDDEDDYEEGETPVTIVNNLNDQTSGKLLFKTNDLCTQKTLDYGPIPAGSKTTLKLSSICYITSITAKPSNTQQCETFTNSDGEIHSGPFTIHPNPTFPKCEVTDTYNAVDLPFTIINGLNVEVTGTLTFKTTEVCQQVPLVYGPLPSGKKTTIYFPSQCFFIKVEANPTKDGSKKCTAFESNDGTQDGNFTIMDNVEGTTCQVTNE